MGWLDDLKQKASDSYDSITTDDVKDAGSSAWDFWKSENETPAPTQQTQPQNNPAPPKQTNTFTPKKEAVESKILPTSILDGKMQYIGIGAGVLVALMLILKGK